MSPDWLTVPEVAELLEKPISTVRRWAANGRLSAKKVGKQWLINGHALTPIVIHRPPNWSSTWRDDVTGAGMTRDEAIEMATTAIRRHAVVHEALADMVNQFAYWSDGEIAGLTTGGLSALEGAFEALGYDDPHPADHQRCDFHSEGKRCTGRSSMGVPLVGGTYVHRCHKHRPTAEEANVCGFRSSVTMARCILVAGHSSDSADRFHKFPGPKPLLQ